MRAAIYARMSADKQSSDSPADQIARCRDFAAAKGWTVADGLVVSEAGISGASRHNRPARRDGMGWVAAMISTTSSARATAGDGIRESHATDRNIYAFNKIAYLESVHPEWGSGGREFRSRRPDHALAHRCRLARSVR